MYLLKNITGEQIFKHDIEDFITTYGYGDCHLMSEILADKYSLDIGIVITEPSGTIVHSFVFLNDRYAFDAHGIDLIKNTVNRYSGSISDNDNDDSIDFIRLKKEEAAVMLSKIVYFQDDDYSNFKDFFNDILKQTDLEKHINDAINQKMTNTKKIKP